MKINEYTQNALKTELKDYNISLSPLQFRKLHAAMGISTEIAELIQSKDGINTAEEIGDVFYYVAIFADALNVDFKSLFASEEGLKAFEKKIDYDRTQGLAYCIIAGGELLDLAKKEIFYKTKIEDKDILEKLTIVVIFLQLFTDTQKLKLEDVLLANIEKLKERYGEKFSTEKANNRDLEAEYEALKNNI